MATPGTSGRSELSTKSGRAPNKNRCGSSRQRAPPLNVICQALPTSVGYSTTVAPRVPRRVRSTWRNFCSSWDSISGVAGSSSVTTQAISSSTSVSRASPERRMVRRCRSAAARETRVTSCTGANGSRHRSQARVSPVWQGQSRSTCHAVCSMPQTVSGSASSARYPVPPGTMSCRSSASAGVPSAAGPMTVSTARWSGAPPRCSRRASSRAARRLGRANASPGARPLGGRGASQRDRPGVLGELAAPGAPRPVFPRGVPPGRGVLLPAAVAEPEQGCSEVVAGDGEGGAAPGPWAQVQPSQRHVAHVLGAEVVVLHVPAAPDVLAAVAGGQHNLVGDAVALVSRVVDRRFFSPDRGRNLFQFHHVQALPQVGDAGAAAAGACAHAELCTPSEVDAIPTCGAERPGVHLFAVAAQVDRVDLDGQPARVERAAGGELSQGLGGGTLDRLRLVLVLLCVGVDPGDRDVECDGVVQQGVVREEAELLQGGDPVFTA